MEHSRPHRPRVSRETRLLLSTAFLAILALWILARIRFPDQPAPATPVQPLLTQLGARASFDDLASELAQLRPRLEPLLVGAALRIRDDAALMLLDEAPSASRAASHGDIVGFDPASRLAAMRVPFLPVPRPVPWKPADPQQPRYLIAAEASAGALALRPVLVGSLAATTTPLWRDPIWLLPAGTDLVPGWFVFTIDALLAGLVIEVMGRPAIVPGTVLLQEADRLLVPSVSAPGSFGFTVQALTPPVARATGAADGVVVTWVDPKGPAAETLAVGDVVEAADGDALATPLHWHTRATRASAGSRLTVRVRRSGEVREVELVAAPASPAAGRAALGLTLRSLAGSGAVVVDVQDGSAADRAGLRSGDVVTRAGQTRTPSPEAVRRAFERAPAGGAVLVAYTRNGVPAVTALDKP